LALTPPFGGTSKCAHDFAAPAFNRRLLHRHRKGFLTIRELAWRHSVG
jgi:hypothetical protein